MAKNTEQSVKNRLHQLIVEMDGSGKNVGDVKSSENGDEVARLLAMFLRWSFFGLLCLGVGFWVGRFNARMGDALNPPPKNQLASIHEGWRTDGTGVFYRWCRGACHAPRLYGGGVIQVFEVHCADRPCGDLLMRFNVLNASSQAIDQMLLREKGVQGELRRFLIETQNPDAASIELSDFVARARI
jgi:hypothetical protein